MAAVTSRKMDDEYLTATAGPTSHSPPPIDVAAITAPGPITRNKLRSPNGGGAGSSSTSHGGSSPCGAEMGLVKRVPRGSEFSRAEVSETADNFSEHSYQRAGTASTFHTR